MSHAVRPQKRALVVSYSPIASDPRVHRQVTWLAEEGWTVDTLGLPSEPGERVATSYQLKNPKPWTTTKWGTAVTQGLMPHKLAFRLLLVDRIPSEVRRNVRRGVYEAVIFNELEFGPWITATKDFQRSPVEIHTHNDLHEYHNPRVRRNTFGGKVTSGYYRWVRGHVGQNIYRTRSSVNSAIGDLYSKEFGIAELVPINNIPRYWDLNVQPVDPAKIKLVFHGLASTARGFQPILEAMAALPDHFDMTFMIMPDPVMEAWLSERIAVNPARDRIHVVPPAPMTQIPAYINEYDIEVIYFPSDRINLALCSPNKLFEAIQGRLAIVTSDATTVMKTIVEQWQNGIVVPGYSGAELTKSLASLTAEKVAAMKEASAEAAKALNAENEGRRFKSLFSNMFL